MTAKKKTSKKATATKEESKRDKFVRLAEMRTTKAINSIRGIGRLSNKTNYDYTEAMAEKICEALRQEVVDLNEQFTTVTAKAKGGFQL